MSSDDFERLCLGTGAHLHLRRTNSFKSTTVDIFIQDLLQRRRNTRVALIGRLLERGTRRLPDMRSLNRWVDGLYGASFAADVDQLGDRQLIHLHFQVLDERFLRHREELLEPGIEFLREVLHHPVREGQGFRRDHLRQEKVALKLQIDSLFNDKAAYAQRRCVEAMCSDEPFGLSPHGDPRDFRGIGGANLMSFHHRLLQENPVDVFVSGQVDCDRMTGLCSRLLPEERAAAMAPRAPSRPPFPQDVREILECQDVNQGRLALGYRTPVTLADPAYPALALYNAILGGEAQSRLFVHLREEAGLCYSIGSHLEPLCGLLLIEAGIEAPDYARVREAIGEQLEELSATRVPAAELDRVRRVVLTCLVALNDSREGLVRFSYLRSLVGQPGSRREFRERLLSVTSEDIRAVAQTVALDTVFFLSSAKASL